MNSGLHGVQPDQAPAALIHRPAIRPEMRAPGGEARIINRLIRADGGDIADIMVAGHAEHRGGEASIPGRGHRQIRRIRRAVHAQIAGMHDQIRLLRREPLAHSLVIGTEEGMLGR